MIDGIEINRYEDVLCLPIALIPRAWIINSFMMKYQNRKNIIKKNMEKPSTKGKFGLSWYLF